MDTTKRNHYNPCFWTALWNTDYYRLSTTGQAKSGVARKQVVNALNLKSQRIYKTIVERVHYEKNLGITELTRKAAEDFVRRYHPDEHDTFVEESKAAQYPVYLDFESILSGIEATPPYPTLLKVAAAQEIDDLVEKSNIAAFIVLHCLRSHAIMNAMIEWHEELGLQKFEHLVTLKWMLSDPMFLFRLVHPLVCSKWTLHTCPDHSLPLCDSPVLVQPGSIMVALSPRLLLELATETRIDASTLPTSVGIGTEKLDEYRRRTIGNTFREIIGEEPCLQEWAASDEFRSRAELMKDVKRYNAMVQANGQRELWHLNAYGNQA